jgi:hypothetical protein
MHTETLWFPRSIDGASASPRPDLGPANVARMLRDERRAEREAAMSTTAMIVMEPGSEWPGQVGDFTNLVAFTHGCEELLRRTQEKLGLLQRHKQSVRVAVLACNVATDDVHSGLRAQLARSLLGAVARTTCGRLILSAGAAAPRELLKELLALTESLAQEVRGTSATVSLRVGEAPVGIAT